MPVVKSVDLMEELVFLSRIEMNGKTAFTSRHHNQFGSSRRKVCDQHLTCIPCPNGVDI